MRKLLTHLLPLRPVLDIQLVKRLDMIARESDRNHDDVVLTISVKSLDGIDGLRTLPGGRTDLGLPGESVAEASEGTRDASDLGLFHLSFAKRAVGGGRLTGFGFQAWP